MSAFLFFNICVNYKLCFPFENIQFILIYKLSDTLKLLSAVTATVTNVPSPGTVLRTFYR